MNRIALFLPNWIGDVVMATPAIRAVHEAFPAADLFAVGKPYVADVVEGSPWFKEFLPFNKSGPRSQRLLSLAARLRHEKIDAAVLFPNSFRSALAARLGGAKTIVGFARYGRGFLLSNRLEAERDARGRFVPKPVIDDYNRLAMALGTTDPGHRMKLFTTDADEAAAAAVWQRFNLERFSKVVAVNPGAAFGASKHWPGESFADLTRKLTRSHDCGVIVLCGPSERDIARSIAMTSRCPRVFSLAEEKLSLGLTKAIVRRCDLLVTTDSGPRHFAAAFDRPVVTLFGPTHIEWTETYFDKAIHLQQKVPCGPCQLRVCPLDHRCMKSLTAETVLKASEQLLARHTHSTPGERRAG